MATKVNYSDLSAPNYETTIRIGTSKTTILFGDYGSCYGEYDETIAVNNSSNPVSTVDSTKLISNYFSNHSLTTNGIVLAGKKFTTDTPAGYIKFTSHGKTMIINVTIIREAVEKNIEFNDSLNNYTVIVEDSTNCSLKLYYIYYEGKDGSGNWKKIKPTSNVLTTINLNFKGIGTITCDEDNYTNQYITWSHIPQQYIHPNNLPVTATAKISIVDDTGATISDTRKITFVEKYVLTFKLRVKINTIFKGIYSTNHPLDYIFAIYGGSDIYESWLGQIYRTGIANETHEINIDYTTNIYERRKLSGYVRITLSCVSGLYATKSNICMYGDTTGYVSLEHHCIPGTKYNNELYYFNTWLPDVELSWEKDLTSSNDKNYTINLDIIIN